MKYEKPKLQDVASALSIVLGIDPPGRDVDNTEPAEGIVLGLDD